jgi:hypothetical protein
MAAATAAAIGKGTPLPTTLNCARLDKPGSVNPRGSPIISQNSAKFRFPVFEASGVGTNRFLSKCDWTPLEMVKRSPDNEPN